MTQRITSLVSHYGAPIVAGLTPFTVTKAYAPDGALSSFPPDRDEERLTRYEEYEALIENRAADVFSRLDLAPGQKTKIALAVALPELICNVWADAIWADPPTFALGNDAATERWQAIAGANDLETLGWESVFGCAFRGTSVVKLRRADLNVEKLDDEIVLEEISPAIYFPVLKAGSSRIVERAWLAWEEDRSEMDDPAANVWQVREYHRLEGAQYTISYQERKKGTERGWSEVRPDERPEGVDFLPFVEMHAKRWSGRYWGVSELTRNWSIFDQIDVTLSIIAEVLEYHGKPMLQVPSSWLIGGVFQKGADKAHGVRSADQADIARYITYDGQIEAQIRLLSELVEKAFLTSEVPPTYFGFAEGGSLSGTALKLRLQNYLKKATRYQMKETRRGRELADYALRLAGGFDPAARLAEISHGSPLPADEEQEARIETSLKAGGLSSRKTSITKLRRVPDVDEEIAAIDEEEAMNPVPARPGAGLPGTQPGAGAPAGLAAVGAMMKPPEAAAGAQAGTQE